MAGLPKQVDVLAGGVLTQLEGSLGPAQQTQINTLLLAEAGRTWVREIYEAMVNAGATVIGTPTFRCQRARLTEMGLHPGAGLAWPVHAAVGTVRAVARKHPGIRIAGTMWPLHDCYRPDQVAELAELEREHAWLATELVHAGMDLILAETMGTASEALAAARAITAAGARAWVSFVCDDHANLLSGEPLGDAARQVRDAGAERVAVNCTGISATSRALAALAPVDGLTVGVYPNLEARDSEEPDAAVSPQVFGAQIRDWLSEYPISMVGGCCGTSVAHVRAAADAVGDHQ